MKYRHTSPPIRGRRHKTRRPSKSSASLRPLGLRLEPLEQRTLLDAAGLVGPDLPQDEGLFAPAEVVAKAVPPIPGDLVVSELNYHPHDLSQYEREVLGYNPPPEGTNTGEEERFEFIEIFNRTLDTDIALGGITLEVFETEVGEGGEEDPRINYVFPDMTLGGRQRVVVVSNLGAFADRYDTADIIADGGLIAEDDYGEGRSLDDPDYPVLPNSGGTVTLKHGTTVLQLFAYNDGSKWPGRVDGSGSSMDKEFPLTDSYKDFSEDDKNDWNKPSRWDNSYEFGGSPGIEGEAEAIQGAIEDVVISEVLSHTDWPQTDAIELHNITNSAINIGGWFLTDSNRDYDAYQKFRIPDDTWIQPNEYIYFDEYDFNKDWDTVPEPPDDPKQFGLSSVNGDDLWLLKAEWDSDAGIDRLTHFADHLDFGAGVNGETFGRTEPNSEGDIYFYPLRYPTLGEENSEPRVGGPVVGGSVGEESGDGPIVISEIMYKLVPDDENGDDSAYWPTEYIEIYNPSSEPINLANWRIRQGIQFDFSDPEDPNPEPVWIQPRSTRVIVPFGEDEIHPPTGLTYKHFFLNIYYADAECPPEALVYDAVPTDASSATYLGSNWGSPLSNGGEKIRLEARDEEAEVWTVDEFGNPKKIIVVPRLVADEVVYADPSANPVKDWPDAKGNGLSLQRYAPHLFGSEKLNWDADDPSPGSAFYFRPYAIDDWAVSGAEPQDVTIGILTNDTSDEGIDEGSVIITSAPQYGTVERDLFSGTVTYTPNPGVHGVIDTFRYTVNSDFGFPSNEAIVTVVVNDPPTVEDFTVETLQDTPIEIDVLALADDPDGLYPNGDPLRIEIVSSVGGVAVINPGSTETDPTDDTVIFTPTVDPGEPAYFKYKVFDFVHDTDALQPATVTINVVSANASPDIDNPIGDINAQEDGDDWSQDLTGVFSDPDGDTLQFTVENSNESLINAYLSGNDLILDYLDNQYGTAIITVEASDGQLSVEDTFTVTVNAVNDPPRLIGSLGDVEVDEDADDQLISLVGLFDDIDGDVLTLTASSDNEALVVASVDGETLTLAFEENQNGSATITVVATDLALATADTTFLVTVNAVNDPPVAVDARVEEKRNTLEETLLQIPVAQLATDIDSDVLEIKVVGSVSDGTAVFNDHGTPEDPSDDTLDVMPAFDHYGRIDITYVAYDGEFDSNEVAIRVIVREVNDPPIARDNSATLAEDGSVTIDVLANDDVGSEKEATDGQTLTLIGVEIIENTVDVGSVSIVANKLVFEPEPYYNGPVRIRYTIEDSGGEESDPEQATAYVDITVTEVNNEPILGDNLTLSIKEDEPGTINVLEGALPGPDNELDQTLELFSVTLVEHGNVVWDPDGTVDYQPDADYFGPATFTFTIIDNGTTNGQDDPQLAIGQVTVDVVAVNDRPIAIDDEIEVDEDESVVIPLLDNDEDADGDELSVVMVDGPSHGVFDPITRIYTPEPNFSDATDTFTYRAFDGEFESEQWATVTITVLPINDLPYVAKPFEPVVVSEDDLPWMIDLTEYFGDVDLDSGEDSLSYSVGSNSNGALVDAVADNGQLTLTFGAEQSGEASIVIRATDSPGEYIESTLSVTVNAVNDAPVALADDYSVAEGGTLSYLAPGVLGNDEDIDSEVLTAELVVGPDDNHTEFFELLPDGGFTFTPESNFSGEITFTYRAYDDEAYSEPVVVTIDVSGVNDPPETLPDEYSLAEDQTLEVSAEEGVLANDSDVEGNALFVDLDTIVPPTHGELVVINPDGSFTYTPDADFAGIDEFKYQANDGQDNSVETTVTIEVTEVNDPPVTTDDTATATEDTLLENIDVLGSDAPGPEGFETDQVLTVSDPVADHGQVTVNPDGTLNYMPDPDFFGEDVITYTLTDDGTTDGQDDPQSATGQVFVTVNPVNDAPEALNDEHTVEEDSTLEVTAPGLLTNDKDAEDDPLSATLVNGPAHGSLDLQSDGSFTYTPDADYVGPDSFTYKIDDGDLESDEATVSITVDPVNDLPVAENDAHETDEDLTLEVPVENGLVSNDTDIDSATLSAVLVDGPLHGELTLADDGSFVYIPDADYFGTDTFTYKAFDGEDESVEAAEVTITVNPINDAPEALNDEHTVEEDSTLEVTAPGLLTNDKDAEGDPLSATLVNGPAHGSLDLQSDGSFTYTPDADYVGPDSFTYKVDDGELESDEATVSITVDPANDPPTAENDTYEVDEDAVLNVDAPGVLENDEDIDGDELSVVLVDGPEHGELVLNEDGSFSYTPEPNFNGTDSFTYRAADELTESGQATVTITVNPVNDVPVADDDTYMAETNQALTVEIPGVLDGDTDIDGDSLTAVLAQGPEHGEFILNEDGSFTYSPNTDFNGLDSFTYRADDGQAESELATVNLTVTRSLGEIDFLVVENQNPSVGELWYRGQAVREGILTIEALFDGVAEQMSMTLFDPNLDELATSKSVNGNSRIDYNVEAGETFLFRVSGPGEDVDLRLANLVLRDSHTVTVHGTAGDDSLQFETVSGTLVDAFKDSGIFNTTIRTLVINGVEYEFLTPGTTSPPLFSLTYHGGEGSDTAVVTGSDDDENVTVYPDRAIVSGANHYIELRDVADTTIYAAGGYNLTTFYDSPGDDEFVGFPHGGLMVGQDFRSIVVDSDEVTAFASAGGQDTVRLYDSWGDDMFVSTSNYGGMLGPGFAVHTQGFETVHAFATLGGYDTAKLYDSRGDDSFYANPTEATFYGNGFYRRGKLFEEVHAYSTAGGNDTADFFGSEGDDEFYASPIESGMSGEGYFNRVKNFETVTAYAGQGENDTATFFDSPANDLFVATPTYGGMSGPGFQNHALQFDSVHALSDAGGRDLAKLYDSPGDDLFEADATDAVLSNGLYSNRAEGFERVHAYATDGGHDRAELHDSDGDDMFISSDHDGALFGEGFYNRAKYFEEVYAHGQNGGLDEAYLYDSPEADLVQAQGNWTRLSNAALDFLYEVAGFNYVKATASSTDDTKDIVEPLDFTLELDGPWQDL